jgi:hypothetical protein
LSGRYPADYYGHSVALGLAPPRRSHVHTAVRTERDLGVPSVSSNALAGHRSCAPEDYGTLIAHRAAGAGTGFMCFPAGEHLHLLETRIQVIRLSPYHADLPAHRPCTWARPPVFCHAVFPYCPFELRSGIRSRDKLLPSLPAARAIQQRASWRTDDVLESSLYLLRERLRAASVQ